MNGGDQALIDIVETQQRRLKDLLRQQQQMGESTPSYITLQIEDIRATILRIRGIVGSSAAEALDAATPGQRTAVITNAVSVGVDRISSAVTTRMDFLDERIDTLQYIIVAMIVVHLLSIITITVLVVDMAYGSRLGGSVWNTTQHLAVTWRSHWLWLLRWAW